MPGKPRAILLKVEGQPLGQQVVGQLAGFLTIARASLGASQVDLGRHQRQHATGQHEETHQQLGQGQAATESR